MVFEQLGNPDATKRGAVTCRPQPFQALDTIFVFRAHEEKLQLQCKTGCSLHHILF